MHAHTHKHIWFMPVSWQQKCRQWFFNAVMILKIRYDGPLSSCCFIVAIYRGYRGWGDVGWFPPFHNPNLALNCQAVCPFSVHMTQSPKAPQTLRASIIFIFTYKRSRVSPGYFYGLWLLWVAVGLGQRALPYKRGVRGSSELLGCCKSHWKGDAELIWL